MPEDAPVINATGEYMILFEWFSLYRHDRTGSIDWSTWAIRLNY